MGWSYFESPFACPVALATVPTDSRASFAGKVDRRLPWFSTIYFSLWAHTNSANSEALRSLASSACCS